MPPTLSSRLAWFRRGRTAAVPFIMVTIFLDVLSFGLVIPVLPALVTKLSGGDLATAATWTGGLIAVFAAMQFVAAPVLGALSDRFGRRSVLLASALGTAVDHLMMAFAPTLGWLLLARLLSGVTAASFPVANAYIADITPAEARAGAFGKLGAAFGLGFILGPVVGGVLGEIDLRLPFLAAAILAGLSFLYGLLFLPESLPGDRRSPFRWARANPVATLRTLGGSPVTLGLAGTFFCLMLAMGIMQAVWVLYTGDRYGWSGTENGLSLALIGLATAIVQGALVTPVVARMGERAAVLGGIACTFLAFIAYGLAPTGLLFAGAILIHAFGGLSTPTMQGILTRQVDPTRQGAVQGAVTSLNNLTFMVAPMLGAALLGWSAGAGAVLPLPGLPFLAAAGLVLAGLVVAARVLALVCPPGQPSAAPLRPGISAIPTDRSDLPG